MDVPLSDTSYLTITEDGQYMIGCLATYDSGTVKLNKDEMKRLLVVLKTLEALDEGNQTMAGLGRKHRTYSGKCINGPYKDQMKVHYGKQFTVLVREGAMGSVVAGHYDWHEGVWVWDGPTPTGTWIR